MQSHMANSMAAVQEEHELCMMDTSSSSLWVSNFFPTNRLACFVLVCLMVLQLQGACEDTLNG